MARKWLKGHGPSPPPRCDSLPWLETDWKQEILMSLTYNYLLPVAGVYGRLVVDIDQRNRNRAPRVRPIAAGAAGFVDFAVALLGMSSKTAA